MIPVENIASTKIYRIDVEPGNFSLFWKLISEVLHRNHYLRANRDSYLTNAGFKATLRAIWESKEFGGEHGSLCDKGDEEIFFSLQLAHGRRLAIQFDKVLLCSEAFGSEVEIDAADITSLLDFGDSNAIVIPVNQHSYRFELLTFKDFLLCKSLLRAFVERNNIDCEITRVSDLLLRGG